MGVGPVGFSAEIPAATRTNTIASGPYATELNASKDRAANPPRLLRAPCRLPHAAAGRGGTVCVGPDRTSSATFLTNRWVPNGAVEPAHRQA